MCLKKLMLTKPTNHVNAFFAITIFFLKIIFRFQTKVCNGYNLMQKAIGFNGIAIASYIYIYTEREREREYFQTK